MLWDYLVLGNKNKTQRGHTERKIVRQHKSCWNPSLVATPMALWASPVDILPQVSPECHGTSSIAYRTQEQKEKEKIPTQPINTVRSDKWLLFKTVKL